MEKYTLEKDIPVFGIHVKTFPSNIQQAFDSLVKNLGNERSYYGVSWFDAEGNIQYYAVAHELFEGEARQYNSYETLTIKKGTYLSETIHNWMSKLNCIKDVFESLMQSDEADKTKPCIEWYKNQDEMACMVKTLI